jgi:fused signal recognition particle receptor
VVSQGLWIALALVAVLIVVAMVLGLVRYRRRQISLSRPEGAKPVDRSGGYAASSGITFTQSTETRDPVAPPAERLDTGGLPAVGDDATVPRDAPKRSISDVQLPEPPVVAPPEPAVPEVEPIAPADGRLERLRGRLAKSQNTLGRSMLGLLGGGDLDEESWESVEDTLLIADLGPVVTESVVAALRSEMASNNVRTEADARAVLRAVLISALQPGLDRSIRALPHDDKPSVLLVVGVNGTGKTTTVGKLARVLVADGRRVVLGAADTFRAAAADQLQSWAARAGAELVRGAEGADPASVAFDAVDKGIETGADVVVIDTAGRLHTKTGLMDELGKVKRVVSKRAEVDEVLLVLDATIGQNGLPQARVFAEVVDITGVVLTKLDGTAKGGIVFRVQQELGVPVKLVGLGEGPDDLAPFEPAAFVDALLG